MAGARERRARCASRSCRRSSATARQAAISSRGSPACRASASTVERALPRRGHRRADRAHPHARRHASSSTARRCLPRSRGRSRRAAPDVDRLSRARHGRDDVRLAALRLAPLQLRRLGAPGHQRARDDRRDVHGRARWSPRARRRTTASAWCGCPASARGTRDRRVRRASIAAALGLPADATLFLFPQSLFKLHPDNDALVAEVLAATGARLVAFEGRHPRLTRTWRARLDPALDARGVARDRVVVLPQVSHERLPAHRHGLRRDARQRPLVGRQHEPRCDRLRAAGRHAARRAHALAAERRDARASRRAGARRARRGRLRRDRRAPRVRPRVARRAVGAHRPRRGAAVRRRRAASTRFAAALEAR